MGILRVDGSIRIAGFWPEGKSDADTVHIEITLDSKHAFKYNGKVTHAFEGSAVNAKPVIKSLKKSVLQKVTIRLQGIDAPELHYRPVLKDKVPAVQRAAYNKGAAEFRQHFGKIATVRLAEKLKTLGTGELKAYAWTRVERPGDAFDVYGRFVGDVVVVKGKKEINLNHWLVENGWVFPAFYNSMTPGEINAILKLWKTGRKKGMGKQFKQEVVPFDPRLVLEKPGNVALELKKDAGPVFIPKLFRRQADWYCRRQGGLFHGNFDAFLDTKTSDVILPLAQFLKGGKKWVLLGSIVSKNKVRLSPDQFVVQEQGSALKRGGKEVTKW